MATVNSWIALQNGVTPGFENMGTLLDGVTEKMKDLQRASDLMVTTTTKLEIVNDGLQTTEELQRLIFQGAENSRSSYIDTANTVSALGTLMGDTFSSNQEMVYFTEQMNKHLIIGGANVGEQKTAMDEIVHAMADGVIQGEEFNLIMAKAPLLAQAIAENMGMTIDEARKMADQGLITTDIIKNSMFAAADATNEKFSRVPVTWEQIWSSIANRILMYLQPLLDFVNLLANNWSILEPIVMGVAAAILYYKAVTEGAALVISGFKALQTFLSIGFGILTGNTAAASAAMYTYNSAVLASPITWIVFAVIALIAVFYAAVAAVNTFAGTSYSATGMIVGAFMVALSFIGNLFIGAYNLIIDVVASIWNYIASFAEFYANVFNDPVGSVVRLFVGMADSILQILGGIAKAADTIFGSNLASAVEGWRSSLKGAAEDLVGEAEIKIDRLDPNLLYMDRFKYSDAYHYGNQLGRDFGMNLGNQWSKFKGSSENLLQIADNTASMKDSMEISEEDLKYLRDVAERDVIDRTVLRDVNVSLSNSFGDVRETADVDGIITEFEQRFIQAVESEAEGDHDV